MSSTSSAAAGRWTRQSVASSSTMQEPRDEEPPLPPASPSGTRSRLRRTLNSLRTPFRPGSPFHIGSPRRSTSNKSSVSDGDLARDERTMRKRNKKNKQEPPADTRSTDSSPGIDKKKKDGFIRRMGSIGKKRAEASGFASPSPSGTKESTLESISPPPEPETTTPETSSTATPTPDTLTLETSTPETTLPVESKPAPTATPETELTPPPSPQVSEPMSPIAVTQPIATRPFTKAAWKRNSEPEMEKPVEEPSPGDAQRRRIAFVAQTSAEREREDADEEGERGQGGAVGSLEEAVALAREKLAATATGPAPSVPPPHAPDARSGAPPHAMPPAPRPHPYGDLIEPTAAAATTSNASPSAERREHLYKILVIGELGTGKTSIIKRYVHQFFSQHYRATIGVDFALKVLNWDANTIIRLQLWDIAGQERFGNMTRVYYKEAVGAFIVFDVSRVATFDAVVKWKNDLDAKVQLPDGSPIPCVLLANKCDQQKEGIVNSPAKMEEYCREKGFAGWFETSAKENINIEEAARSLVNKILLNDKLLQSNDRDGEKFALEHKIANGENSRDSGGKSCSC